jgi:hypothetical protein
MNRESLQPSASKQAVQTDWTPFTPDSGTDASGLPSLTNGSLGPHRRFSRSSAMRLTERDRAIIDLVFRAHAVRQDQVEIALFPLGSSATRCQLRLRLLVRNRYLDRLPRKGATDPWVYVLSRRSSAGNRLIRERYSAP